MWKYWRGTARIKHGKNLKCSLAEMIKKLQAFDSLNYSLRRLKCEWQETKKNQPEIILNFYHIKFGLCIKFDICTVLHLSVSCDHLCGRMSDCAEIPSNTFLCHSDLQKKKLFHHLQTGCFWCRGFHKALQLHAQANSLFKLIKGVVRVLVKCIVLSLRFLVTTETNVFVFHNIALTDGYILQRHTSNCNCNF